MKTFLAALLLAATAIPASAHSAKLQYLTKPTDDIIISQGDKPRHSGQIVVLTDSNIHGYYNIHGQRQVYVVCKRDVFQQEENRPCHMVIIIGDEIIEQINGVPVVHRTKGKPWRI